MSTFFGNLAPFDNPDFWPSLAFVNHIAEDAPPACLLECTRCLRRLRTPLRTAKGTLSVRESLLLQWRTADGQRFAQSEIAPFPGLPGESVADAERFVQRLAGQFFGPPGSPTAARAPDSLPCTAFGLADWLRVDAPPAPPVASAALAAIDAAPASVPANAPVIKLKVGSAPPATELQCFARWAQHHPAARFRLDPNQAWSPAIAQSWAEALSPALRQRIEFVEQPFPDAVFDFPQLTRFAQHFPLPLALDEWLSSPTALRAALASAWPGFFVIKASLLGDPAAWLPATGPVAHRCVVSSVFESPIGLQRLQHLATHFPATNVHGLGTAAFFDDSVCSALH